MKKLFILIFLAGAVLAYQAYTKVLSKDVSYDMGKLTIIKKDGSTIDVKAKFADSKNEHAQGLMFIKEMPEDEGMLFIFEREEMRKMWMDNTFISLDMLFINSNLEIFNYAENTTPLSRDLVLSVFPAKYVLEVNAGFVKRHGIRAGDKIEYEIE